MLAVAAAAKERLPVRRELVVPEVAAMVESQIQE
jgi:hypothetical protein